MGGDLDGMEERRVIRILTVYSVGHYYIEDGPGKGIDQGNGAPVRNLYQQAQDEQTEGIRGHHPGGPRSADTRPARRARRPGHGQPVDHPEREELVDFSIPVSKPIREILVTGPSAPELGPSRTWPAGPCPCAIPAVTASLEQLNATLVAAGRPPVKIRAVDESLEGET